jgi:hypothetical protein
MIDGRTRSMINRCTAVKLSFAIAIGLTASGAARASDPTQLIGAKSAAFSWAAASGAVAGYYVIVSRNGSGPELATFATDPMASVDGKYGDSIVVQVAAYDSTGAAGPLSPPSQTIVFSPPAGSYSNGGGGGSTSSSGRDPAAPLPASLDFTGDGVPDLIARDAQTGAVAIWQMSGSVVTSVIDLPNMPADWEIVGNGDYDANGVADILWQNQASGALEIWNMAGGAVAASSAYALEGLESEGRWIVVGSGDFDGDSRDDILLLNRVVGVIEIVREDASGAMALWSRFESYGGAWTVSATPDLDADGIAEIVWSDALEHRVVIWRITGLDVAEAILLPQTIEGWRVAGFGDENGDGTDDLLLLGTGTPDAQIWLMSGAAVTGSLAVPAAASATGTLVSGGGDYDADGTGDLLNFDPGTGAITIWRSTASGFVPQPVTGAALSAGSALALHAASDDSDFRRKLCSADLDGDSMVGGSDFSVFSQCYGQPATGGCEPADLDSNGVVGGSDYALLFHNFGGPECANGF